MASSPLGRREATALPAYQLYGEAGTGSVGERLHVETISARSRLHEWEIRPHRHELLFQILYMAHGHAEAQLDGRRHRLAGPAAVTVPAATAHGFVFEPGIDGWIVTVQELHVRQLLTPEPGLWPLFERPTVLAWGSDTAPCAWGSPAQVTDAVAALAGEFAGHRRWRHAAIDAELARLLLALARALPGPADGLATEAPQHLSRYRALVDARFRLQPSVASLAAELGISTTQLNRICRAQLGKGALDLLHARVALEAQRQLAYTNQSIKRIGMDLGFADPGYFTRFFQRLCGLSPTAWRRRAHQG
ncbi:MAG TPA: helix-turn-helix domain-containing protein [Ideonella sp.]|uniref:helix-turn-helix domain-containing protein n=1 Tax=Ideonella sp. TaxID=1929293 RepID=UPI002E3715FE|nr:helix-turn-helix domain-containing protein [Ideonella sp.]HEX5688139.1 helix-turn-helix domain-containing protein [Ideonella sp.]